MFLMGSDGFIYSSALRSSLQPQSGFSWSMGPWNGKDAVALFLVFVKVVFIHVFRCVICMWGLRSQCPQLVIRTPPHHLVLATF